MDANQVGRYVFNVWHHVSLATNNTCKGIATQQTRVCTFTNISKFVVTLQDQTGKVRETIVVKFTTFMACFCTGHCPCKCDMSCQVVVETPVFNITSSGQSCDVPIYCTLRDILDAISKFTSTVWGGGVFVLGSLLVLGMLKMCIESAYCKHTDVDSLVMDIVAGKKRHRGKNAWENEQNDSK